MNVGDWLLTVGSLVLGAFLVTGVEWLRGRMERRQRRGDRDEDFRRDMLLQLQTAINAYVRASHIGHADYFRTVAPSGEFYGMNMTRDNALAQDDAWAQVQMLTAQLNGDGITGAVEALRDAVRKMLAAETVDDANSAQADVWKERQNVHRVTGRALHELSRK